MDISNHIFTAPPLIKQTPYIPTNEHNHSVLCVSKQPLKFNHSFYSYKTKTWALSSYVRVGDWHVLLPVLIKLIGLDCILVAQALVQSHYKSRIKWSQMFNGKVTFHLVLLIPAVNVPSYTPRCKRLSVHFLPTSKIKAYHCEWSSIA